MFPFKGCSHKKDRGRSDGTIHCSYPSPAYYWDTTEGRCRPFGALCIGNQNKFRYRYQCEDACGKYGVPEEEGGSKVDMKLKYSSQ